MIVSHLRTNRGMSLLEVMVTMVVLALGLLGLAPFMVIAIDANSISRDAVTASVIVREKIEFLEGQAVIPNVPSSEFEEDVRSGFDRTTVITTNASDSTIPNGLVRAAINVAWVDDMGNSRQTTFQTFLEVKP